jgi:hypothetical protein
VTTAGGTRRWPVHPPPAPGEALTSWLGRLARLYDTGIADLLRDALGEGQALLDDPRAADLDFDPPSGILRALAERAGADPGAVRMTTVAGWVPWLAGTLDPSAGQDAFDDYARRQPVLLVPGEAGRSDVPRWLPWMPASDGKWRTRRRACLACTAGPGCGTRVLDALPLMTTCGEHGLPLQPEDVARAAVLFGEPVPPWAEEPPPPPAVAAMDRLTWEGITTGMVTLPGRPVHVGVWLRILRTLLDEVSIRPGRLTRQSAAAITRIWEAAGRPPRGGLTVWRPYERLDRDLQQAMTEAAATALHLAASGEITPRGPIGRCLAPEPHRYVYEGDREEWEHRQAEAELRARCQQQVALARSDPGAARQLLVMFTAGCRTYASFYRERRFLITKADIPEELLPDHVGIGRTDLRF